MTADRNSQFKAQFGEDRLLDEYFSHKRTGYFVEIGAYNGVDFSNTYFFENAGWTGVLIEPDPEEAASCRRLRPNSTVIACAAVAPDAAGEVTFQVVPGWKALSARQVSRVRQGEELEGDLEIRTLTVPARTIDAILEEQAPAQIDFVTIDVEGGEWDVLKGFSLDRWQPRIVIVERAAALPERRIIDHMHEHGYVWCRTTGSINDWFERKTQAAARAAVYRIGFYLRLTLPGTVVEKVVYPVRRFARAALKRVGLFELARRLLHGDER